MSDQLIQLQTIGTESLHVPVIGTAPLIVHRFSEKAKRQMLDNMQGTKSPKAAKDPERDYKEAFYLHDDGRYGLPAMAFKAATVGGARFFGKSISMTALRQIAFFDGEFSTTAGQKLVHIEGEPHMREDVVSVGNGGHDLRYRPEFTNWATTLRVTYVATMITRDSMMSLIQAGGMGVGVGEWRPEKKGAFGTYEIDTTREIRLG